MKPKKYVSSLADYYFIAATDINSIKLKTLVVVFIYVIDKNYFVKIA